MLTKATRIGENALIRRFPWLARRRCTAAHRGAKSYERRVLHASFAARMACFRTGIIRIDPFDTKLVQGPK